MASSDLSPLVADLREASRRVVRHLGLLQRNMPTLDHSTSQCHMLIELERRRRATVAEIADIVRLDRSTTSRALRGLERAGLVEPLASPGDRRRKPVRLTRQGRRVVADIHSRSDRQVESALACLDGPERKKVVEGMSLYARALERSRRLENVRLRPIRRRDVAELEQIIVQVLAEYGAGSSTFQYDDPDIGRLYDAMRSSGGEYIVAERDGRLLGGVGFGPLVGGGPEDCELQKMYLLPDVRGLGLGARLLRHCLERAHELGYSRCYLETMAHMVEARRLYERHGFEQLEGPMGRTGHDWCNTFYARDL